MKLTKSKQFLANAIRASGKGWPDGAGWAAQDKRTPLRGMDIIVLYKVKPQRPRAGSDFWGGNTTGSDVAGYIQPEKLSPNWHQTVLSREEYFSAYPAEPVAGAGEERLSHEAVKAARRALLSESVEYSVRKPSIEQLAADYRNKLDYANRKQDEADKANMESDAALSQLEDAIAAIGFVITPLAATEKEPELVAAVKVGDQVECVESNIKRDKYNGMVGRLHFIDESDTSTPYLVDFGGEAKIWCHEVKFIRRPQQQGDSMKYGFANGFVFMLVWVVGVYISINTYGVTGPWLMLCGYLSGLVASTTGEFVEKLWRGDFKE